MLSPKFDPKKLLKMQAKKLKIKENETLILGVVGSSLTLDANCEVLYFFFAL
jgi:hypothetical protein